MTSGRAVLEFEAISKTYRTGLRRRSVTALSDVDLRVEPGEILGLLGHNGAGKTTLMKLALGLLRPSSGRGRILGKPLGDVAARCGIGYLPEEPYLYPALTVSETLSMMIALNRVPRRSTAARIETVVAQCALGCVRKTPVRKLSRGWLRRLGLAVALVGEPQLLLLDEPLSGLDPEARMAVKSLIRSLRQAGMTILVSSHILPDVELLADRVALLRHGRLLTCRPLAELLDASAQGYEIEARLAGPVDLDEAHERIWQKEEEGRVRWWFPHLDASRLQRMIARLTSQKAAVLAVSAHRESLEEIFVRAMRNPEGEGAQPLSRVGGERG
ncbi:MAG: ATP-binding cassette domain-containing protein [Candidatus Eisenbacteria bacterium]|nr:ATP-binding cassette domain-containing protein [Candidatus Eisenbacteria bacterium]